jgi:acetylornithine deacetylase/succinyl-diaminopimelate desuccinylase-like protein
VNKSKRRIPNLPLRLQKFGILGNPAIIDANGTKEGQMERMDQTLAGLFERVDAATEELLELHGELVRIPTVNTGAVDSGNEMEACRLLEGRLAAEGIGSVTLESAPGRGNLIANLGQAEGPCLMLMSHTDVVPVEEAERWTYPPFGAQRADGYVYGRGSSDDKGSVATAAMALILMRRAGIPLQGQLRLLAAADEEAGSRYGVAWLAEHHPERIRADWAINEGGGTPLETPQGLAYLVAIGEKGRMEAHFELRGSSGHAARPWLADNALYKLERLLGRLRAYRPEINVDLPVFGYLERFGVEGQATPENLDTLLAPLAEAHPGRASTFKALSRLTVTPTMATAGVKANSIPAVARLTCDIRSLPHQDEAYVRRELERMLEGIEGGRVELEVTAISNASPYDAPFVERLARATRLALGEEELTLLPSLTAGFTDSRCVRPLGTQVYGFGPSVPGTDLQHSGVHGVDERKAVENLVFELKVKVALAYLVLGRGTV